MKRKHGQVRGDEDVPIHSNLDYRIHNEKKQSNASHAGRVGNYYYGYLSNDITSVLLYPCTGVHRTPTQNCPGTVLRDKVSSGRNVPITMIPLTPAVKSEGCV